MENIDPALIQQFLQTYTNDSTDQPLTLFPQELIDMIAIGLIALVVISALFLLVYIIGTIRKLKVQSAILDMHKDVKLLTEQLTPSKPQNKINKDTSKIA